MILLLLALAGCKSDNGILGGEITSVAVTAGDFDRVAEPLDRMVVNHDTYEGIISTATWDPTYQAESIALKVEDLLGSANEIGRYDNGGAVLIASGTRGLGAREYNGLDPDDHLVTSDVVLENARRFVQDGGTLVATDWAYDLVEAAWPDAIDFLDRDDVLDGAQKGEIGTVLATVEDASLAEDLEMEQMSVHFNYSNWAVMEDVGEDTVVYLRGDVAFRPDGVEVETLEGVPVMAAFQPPDARGKVVFLAFHVDAQTPAVMDRIVTTTIGSFVVPPPTTEGL